jgi:hypothetical protein
MREKAWALPGGDTPDQPGESDVLDADYALQGLEVVVWRWVVECVVFISDFRRITN